MRKSAKRNPFYEYQCLRCRHFMDYTVVKSGVRAGDFHLVEVSKCVPDIELCGPVILVGAPKP